MLRNDVHPNEHDVEEAFDGNLCRCTGYRPILDAAQSFNNKMSPCSKATINGGAGCCREAENGIGPEKRSNGEIFEEAKRFAPPDFIEYQPDTELIFPPALRHHDFKPLAFGNKRKRWYRPVTLQQLLEIKSANPSAKLISGSTETQIEGE